MIRFLCFLLLTGLSFPLGAAPAVQDFRTVPPGKLPSGWRLYQKLRSGQAAPAVTGKAGERFVRIHTDGIRNAPAVGMARNFPVRPGQKYRISFRLRNPDPAVPVQVNFNGIFRYEKNRYGHGKWIKRELSSGGWETFSMDLEAPLTAEELIVELHTGWNRPGTLDAADYTSDFLTPDGCPSTVFGKRKITPRELYLNTSLAGAAIVVHTPEHRKLAEAINQVLPTPLPVTDAAAYAKCRKLDRNLIMLGNAEDNPAVFNLYMRHYVILDSRYPGPGGWNVRSLHNPFGDGHNVIFAGGSDTAGHRMAAERLKAILRKYPEQLPRLAEICYPKAGEIRLAWGCEWDGFFGYGPISRNFAAYYMTGDAKYVRDALRIAFPDREQVRRNNRMDRYDDGADPIAKPYHYWGSNLALYWDMIEEDPVFSPKVRLRFTQKLYEQMQYWIRHGYGGWYRIYLNPLPHAFLADRHYLMEALCVYTVARYFEKYYPCMDSREGLRCCRNTFEPVWNGVTPQHGWRVWSPSMLFPALQYAMLEDWPRCRENANFRGYADYLLLITSLRSGEWLNGFCGLYGAMALVLEDGAFARMQRHFMRDPDAALIGPAYWSLNQTFPRDSLAGSIGKIRMFRRKEMPEYISLRTAADGTGDYLLLAPRTQPGSRAAFGNNAVEELQIAGQPVIEGASQLYFSADGLAEDVPPEAAEVLYAGIIGDTAVFRTRLRSLPDYEWMRTLFFRKEKFLLVHDALEIHRDCLARIENVWRPVPYSTGKVTANGDILNGFAGGLVPGAAFTRNGRELFPMMRTASRRSYDEFTGCTLISNGPAELHFTLEKAVHGPLYWSILAGRETGKISFLLDGRPLKSEVPVLDSFSRIRLDAGALFAGKHVLKANFSGSCRFGRFSIGGTPFPVFRLCCSAPGVAECIPARINAPDGGGTLPGRTDVFTLTQRVKKGDRTAFATLISTGRCGAAERGDRIFLRLPEAAVLTMEKGRLVLTESGRENALCVGNTVQQVPRQITDAELARLTDAALQTAVQRDRPPSPLPETAPAEEMNIGAPVSFLLPVPDGFAAAAGNKLFFRGIQTWSHTFRGKIGALHWWKSQNLLTAGTDAEEIAAFTPDGRMKFCVKSESAPEFIAANKIFWFKKQYPGIYALASVRFANGMDCLIAGSTGTVEVLRPDGTCVKRFQQEYGPVDNFAVLNGKVFSSRSYGAFPATCMIESADGKLVSRTVWMMESRAGTRMDRFGYNGVGKDWLFASGNRLAGVFSGARNHLMIWEENGRIAADLPIGSGGIALPRSYAVPALSERTIRGFAAGQDGLAAVTDKRLLYLIRPDGTLRRTVPIPAEPFVLAAAPGGWLIGVKDAVLFFDAAGNLREHRPVAGKTTALAAVSGKCRAGTDTGKVYLLQFSTRQR